MPPTRDQDGVSQLFADSGSVVCGDEPLPSPELFLLVPGCEALASELVPDGAAGRILSPTQGAHIACPAAAHRQSAAYRHSTHIFRACFGAFY